MKLWRYGTIKPISLAGVSEMMFGKHSFKCESAQLTFHPRWGPWMPIEQNAAERETIIRQANKYDVIQIAEVEP